MKPNPIFNLKRFNALIGSGFNKKGNNILAIFQWILVTLFIVTAFSIFIKSQDVELQTMRAIMIRFYQISYVLVLAMPALGGMSRDDDKIKLWRMLPASLFEKTLYFYLRSFVWFSILFFAAQFLIDRLFWSAMADINTDTSAYRIGLKEIFTLGDYFHNAPGWIRYTATFFYMALVPLCANGYSGPTRQLALPFSFYLVVLLFIYNPLNYVLMYIMISISVLLYIAMFTEAIIKSYRGSK